MERRLTTDRPQLEAVMMARARIIQRSKRVKLTLFRNTPGHHDSVPAKHYERRRGHRPKRTRIIQRCTR
jgi:hypothetical protein